MASEAEIHHIFIQVTPALHLAETEDSWKKIDRSLNRLDEITKQGAYKLDIYITLIKENAPPIVSALLSERTKLSGSAADLVTSLAPRLGSRFEALISTFVPPLIQTCARTNKVSIARAKKCLLLIAKHCRLPSLLPYLRDAAHSKSTTLRNVSVEVMLTLLESTEDANKLVGRRVGDIEDVIRSTATDRDPEVRQWCRKAFELYTLQWPGRVEEFAAAFTPTTKRYLSLSHTAKSENSKAAVALTVSVPSATKQVRRPLQKIQPTTGVRAASTTETEPKGRTRQEASSSVRSQAPATETKIAPSSTSRPVKPPLTKREDVAVVVRQHRVKSATRPEASAAATHEQTRSASSSKPAEGVIPDCKLTEVEEEIETERAVLRAEITRMSSATPSRGIAARLALQQFEMRNQTRAGQSEAKPRAALTAFAVAASKKCSPKRMPARVLLAPPQSERKSFESTTDTAALPQRLPNRSKDLKASPASDAEKDRPASPDVFESRPMPKEIQRSWNPAAVTGRTINNKKVSTISKGLSAKSNLLGPKVEVNILRNPKRAVVEGSAPKPVHISEPSPVRFFADAVVVPETEVMKKSPATMEANIQVASPKKNVVSLSALLARKMLLTQSRKM